MRLLVRSRSSILAVTLATAASTACEPTDTLTIAVVQYNDPASVVVETFTEELHRLVTNRPITYLRVNAQEDRTALERESRRVVRDEPDLVVAMGGVAANAIYHAGERGTVPAVIGFVDYGKTVELVDATQARGGQMTGVATLGMTLTGKALETLVTTDPAIQRVLFVHSTNPAWVSLVPDLFETTDLLGAELVVSEVVTAEEAARTFDRIQSGDVDAILLSADQTVLDARDAVRALSHRAEIPIITLTSNPVGGAVMSLGSDALDSARQLAVLAARVLRGTPAGDLPVEIPRHVLLRLYADNAREVGYTFTAQTRAAADEVVGDLRGVRR